MNNNVLKDLKYKVFQSGNPVFFYVGVNVLIYVVITLLNVPFFLSGKGGIAFDSLIREYAGFPASVEKLPFRFYTIITYQFFHGGLMHVLFNMLWLFWVGNIFLDFLKPRQFHFLYLSGGIAGALVFLLAYNIFPVFQAALPGATVIGASASVMAIIVGTATLVPDYSMRLLFFGDVKLKYLAIAYVVLDLIGIGSADAGASFAHLGGAVLGFAYIKVLKSGIDWSNLFKRKPKLRVVKNESAKQAAKKETDAVNQEEIDRILDKISKTGYDKLSKQEKETLFKASKN
ncbi:rhomboid family intramembrane serine protease [Pedobacter nyackensis]|uniref:Membrane associated serine protease, rhomboid family n=1 Tax=Pedobacter nyackensis TaxID=475255 RepID=A0A1W2B6R3_9SPHI|nr:rhomboid family intramembrane serine protease [Pedobacter nyackensis]SMC68665.1 Membrane associated serine protease, rhomboid family [Pedobacter nyackensis]